ncbi:MAG: hypothetical protein ACREJX_04025, partial [Polyangiaceae bacterium]
ASGGVVLRANAGSTISNGPQMTADYFGGENNVKRIAIPLAAGVSAADITGFTFDAYDNDGIYFMAVGDAFVAEPSGSNGATLTYVHKGKTSSVCTSTTTRVDAPAERTSMAACRIRAPDHFSRLRADRAIENRTRR